MNAPTVSALVAFTQAQMARHGEDSAAAALAFSQESAGLWSEASAADLELWLRSAEHVLLGHQDDASGLETLLQALAAQLPQLVATPPLESGLLRTRTALALAADAAQTPASWGGLGAADRVRACYNPALAWSRRQEFPTAQHLMHLARSEAEAAPQDKLAQRSLAALAHNLSADWRQSFEPGDSEAVEAMLDAARLARQAWAIAGGWLEVERADWQLAMCYASAGRGREAQQHAQASLAACEAHQADGADDFEFCFAWQAMALAAIASRQREAAQAARAQMANFASRLQGGDADYAQACLAEIDAAFGRLTAPVEGNLAGDSIAQMTGQPDGDAPTH